MTVNQTSYQISYQRSYHVSNTQIIPYIKSYLRYMYHIKNHIKSWPYKYIPMIPQLSTTSWFCEAKFWKIGIQTRIGRAIW